MVKAIAIFLCLLTTNILAATPTKDLSREIDNIIAADLKRKKEEMPVVASSFVFVRRAYLDIVGRVPTYEEWKAFIKISSIGVPQISNYIKITFRLKI